MFPNEKKKEKRRIDDRQLSLAISQWITLVLPRKYRGNNLPRQTARNVMSL